MIPMTQLWLPLVLSAVLVFIASSVIHMVLKWHNTEYLKLPNEDEVRAALRKAGPPGQYVVPHCVDMKQMQAPEMQQKYIEGPVAFIMLRKPGMPKMGPALAQWFALNLLVACIAACVAASTLPLGASPARAFHVTGLISFIAYAGGSLSSGIWKGQPWKSVGKELLDAAIFGIAGGAPFALLWPG
ncbi:MAG TPA: hypothetical protein VM369_09175 [Candidatus Binatia bacterium]|nr:hypothetical protein [Candidatus Binatia bacterium]